VSTAVRLLGLELESHRWHGCLSLVNVVVVRYRSQRLITRPEDPTKCAVSDCYLEAS